jgi:hypothetical protein
MGLDMYLSARKYVNKIDWNKLNDNSDMDYATATMPQWNEIVNAADMQDVANVNDIYGVSVSVNCAYWRKVNAVHNWFVKNVQNNEDDCGEYYVSREKLLELMETARQALFHKDPNLLPPVGGFFFGNTDINEWYWEGVKSTIKQIKRLSELPDFDELSFYYQSSW